MAHLIIQSEKKHKIERAQHRIYRTYFMLRVVWVLHCLLLAGSAHAQDTARAASAEGRGAVASEETGPTIQLNYSRATFEENPISSFMYFVPLISRTPVDRETSAGNEQEVGIISYERRLGSDSFVVVCAFEIRGTGFHRNTFDPVAMIASRTRELRRGATLEGVLDYVNFEGAGLGEIEVRGIIKGARRIVTDVDLTFNTGSQKSPVTIGLYDIKPVDGQYKYANRSNEVVVRVNTLSFTRTSVNPTMGIKVASVRKPGGSEGFFARTKGLVANLGITPPEIETIGNETILRLGLALFHKDPEFTFPFAKNLEHDEVIEP